MEVPAVFQHQALQLCQDEYHPFWLKGAAHQVPRTPSESDQPSSRHMRKKTKVASTASNDKYEMLIDERRQYILELVQKQGQSAGHRFVE